MVLLRAYAEVSWEKGMYGTLLYMNDFGLTEDRMFGVCTSDTDEVLRTEDRRLPPPIPIRHFWDNNIRWWSKKRCVIPTEFASTVVEEFPPDYPEEFPRRCTIPTEFYAPVAYEFPKSFPIKYPDDFPSTPPRPQPAKEKRPARSPKRRRTISAEFYATMGRDFPTNPPDHRCQSKRNGNHSFP
eukprot:GHVO01014902.1.p2 GENE.GHVO01014902.1~~GHVO01014902.1.p2  ORF type:complete len:184 (+),score=23.69 GHVO01014902.1:640-1191(+)